MCCDKNWDDRAVVGAGVKLPQVQGVVLSLLQSRLVKLLALVLKFQDKYGAGSDQHDVDSALEAQHRVLHRNTPIASRRVLPEKPLDDYAKGADLPVPGINLLAV